MTTANTISTLFGKMARFSPLKRARRLNHRFLCPNCLHFGGFDFACGECWAEIPDYADGKKNQTCPRCQRSLLSDDGGGVRAYCKQCKGNCDRAIYHQRQVRVLATLLSTDSQWLRLEVRSGQKYMYYWGRGHVYDNGTWLTYVLHLRDFTDKAHSLPLTHALWEVESIWLNAEAGNPKELALELGKAVDSFIAQARLTETHREAMTACVKQTEVDPLVQSILETRFGKVRYGISGQAFLCEEAQVKVAILQEIGNNSTVPALIGVLRDRMYLSNDYYNDLICSWSYVRYRINELADSERAACLRINYQSDVPALIDVLADSKSATSFLRIHYQSDVPALIDALKYLYIDVVRYLAAEALGKIGKDSAVPALIAALADSDHHMRDYAALALYEIGYNSDIPARIVAGDDDVSRRRWVAEALGEIGKRAVPTLEAADLKYHSDFLCSFCDALRQLGAR